MSPSTWKSWVVAPFLPVPSIFLDLFLMTNYTILQACRFLWVGFLNFFPFLSDIVSVEWILWSRTSSVKGFLILSEELLASSPVFPLRAGYLLDCVWLVVRVSPLIHGSSLRAETVATCPYWTQECEKQL